MPAYRPDFFWEVLFAWRSSAVPRILPRAVLMALPAVVPYLLNVYDLYTLKAEILLSPFSLLVGLLIAFRLGDAYKKWNLGMRCMTDLHSSSNLVISMLCSYIIRTEETEIAVTNVRRLMVLACVSIARAIRSEKERYDSLLATHRPLLTSHSYSLLTTHYSMLTTLHYSPLITHYSLLTTHKGA